MKFKIIKENKIARAGKLIINNNIINTPVFMPVATKGVLKTLSSNDLYDMNYKIILSNTLHLMIRPGEKILKKYNGIHNYMNWHRAVLTDSGGFQLYSLKNRTIKKNSITFKSTNNGKNIVLTPLICVKTQEIINSDIIMVLDECTKYPISISEAYKSMKQSLDWAKIFKKNHTTNSALFGIIQGSIYPELRNMSLCELKKINFDGYAIGGLSVGESKTELINILDYLTNKLPKNKPRYLMGVGSPQDLVESVLRGIDMFDCVIPTRNARNGHLYTSHGIIKIKNNKNKYITKKLDDDCSCYTCKNYTVSYLYNLYKSKETLAHRLNTIHNLKFYKKLMEDIRNSIINDKIEQFLYNFYKSYKRII
ncbi:MAG TPA: tRNA guanosine(34) transglycosylase Tgt [Candidatus Azoamicus sp. OHIO1]